MHVKTVSFDCTNVSESYIESDHTAHSYSNYELFTFESGDEELKNAIISGKVQSVIVNPKDTGGRIRSNIELELSNIRGKLSEFCTEYLFQRELSQRGINGKLVKSDVLETTIEGVTQVDLTLILDDKTYEIETRSSCVRNGIDFGINSGFINLLGWYSTASKPGETKKDFYLMYLFGFDAPYTASYLKNSIDVAFVAGASKSMLQGSLGSDETLKKSRAHYRGIHPICASLDSKQIMDAIFS